MTAIGPGKSVGCGFGTVGRIGRRILCGQLRHFPRGNERRLPIFSEMFAEHCPTCPCGGPSLARARGDAEPDSDVDVMLELDIERLDLSTKRRIRRVAGEVSLQHGLLISFLIVDRAQARERGDYAIFANIREEGIPL